MQQICQINLTANFHIIQHIIRQHVLSSSNFLKNLAKYNTDQLQQTISCHHSFSLITYTSSPNTSFFNGNSEYILNCTAHTSISSPYTYAKKHITLRIYLPFIVSPPSFQYHLFIGSNHLLYPTFSRLS